MIRSAGTPMDSMFSEASNRFLSRNPEQVWKMIRPMIIIVTAIRTLNLAACVIRFLFLAP